MVGLVASRYVFRLAPSRSVWRLGLGGLATTLWAFGLAASAPWVLRTLDSSLADARH